MSDAGYPYDKGDLLASPNTYFYSPFHGAAFLGAWREARDFYNSVAPSPPPLREPVARRANADEIETAFLLDTLVATLQKGALTPDLRFALDALLRNFEAKKRLYEAYAPGFSSKGRSDCHDLKLYVRFGEVLALAYDRHAVLPYLNALHKCLDILCSMHERLSAEARGQVAWLIAQEQQHIAALAHALGVGLP